ncbi:MAG: response regulator [Thiohalocapsa sp.]|jgi:CheY-like chemotaxis protein|uniref:response regulator n=1 Tax=Thiohalocapsa sp. TaxID=2497641 RepID=UPI0025D08737|nr:response regulator [Thiohalocapsa sp.]MCG6940437.1 response regulator [Thiohalocapsa sp.]
MSKRILIIDDDAAVRETFRLSLQQLPYELVEADNGEAGAALAAREDFDLVYLDLRMPGIDGVETLRRIRAVKPTLIVYIVTAFHREYFDDLVTARGEGLVFELLRKPLERRQIIEITTGVLSADGARDGG